MPKIVVPIKGYMLSGISNARELDVTGYGARFPSFQYPDSGQKLQKKIHQL